MWYSGKHIAVKTPEDWYNLIAGEYKKYHNHLNWFDKWFFQRILPRDLNDIDIIDLWAGDWRVRDFFKDKPIKSYTACDISEKILKRHPWVNKIKKVICNLEEDLPFQNDNYQLALSFFVIEHIENIESLIQEVYRILKPGWQRIIWYFFQRREFVWKSKKETFKIKLYNHKIQEIEEIWKANYFHVDLFPIREDKTTIWYIISFKKD